MTRRKTKEQDIQKAIKEYLQTIGCVVVKINNVGIKKPNGKYIPTHQAGVSDLLFCTKEGRFGAVEVKHKSTLTAYQHAFLLNVHEHGGIAVVAHSVEDVMEAMKEPKGISPKLLVELIQ